VLDVDGVLTDGTLYFSSAGDEIKAFNIQDNQGSNAGHGVTVHHQGSQCERWSCAEVGVRYLIRGDKVTAFGDLPPLHLAVGGRLHG
jgi:3-deoxy-D-manno-octulosonate 8-phosphate phosphatase (KDO 8-P phosphatase)